MRLEIAQHGIERARARPPYLVLDVQHAIRTGVDHRADLQQAPHEALQRRAPSPHVQVAHRINDKRSPHLGYRGQHLTLDLLSGGALISEVRRVEHQQPRPRREVERINHPHLAGEKSLRGQARVGHTGGELRRDADVDHLAGAIEGRGELPHRGRRGRRQLPGGVHHREQFLAGNRKIVAEGPVGNVNGQRDDVDVITGDKFGTQIRCAVCKDVNHATPISSEICVGRE
ncbi:MAG: hypothetical protein BWY25_00554 [Chloroflexi bacterium ADurb.Bin222]|nr:MAG: hypothetical protein BWY25_00554 [Chloroflexi bacterium ADurb.Bin222]